MTTNKPIWQEYDGKEVLFQYGGGAVLGKLSIDPERSCMDFLPYLAYEVNGKNVRLETTTPRRISLRALEGSYDFQTLRNGDLEKKVEVINKEVGNSTGFFGFAHK